MSLLAWRGKAAATLVALTACAGFPDPPPPPPVPPLLVDTDGDGISDDRDRCPTQAEDCDGFEDEDGCPDDDDDGDGILDACDRCPFEPETVNGYDDDDGCPDQPMVRILESQIRIVTTIRFAKGKAVVPPDAATIIDALADTIAHHPEIELVAFVGHRTPDEPDALAQQRAEAVVRAVVAKGVDASRLVARSAGARAPLVAAPNDPGNRCVDFAAERIDGRAVGTWDGRAVGRTPPPTPAPAKDPKCPMGIVSPVPRCKGARGSK